MAGNFFPTRLSSKGLSAALLVAAIGVASPAQAGAVDLASHKAIYDIHLVSAKNGSQVIDVRGKMFYSVRKSCDGWISDHKFNLTYEYSGAPSVAVDTQFTSFESFDGKTLNFSSSSLKNGEYDKELRGRAHLVSDGPQDKSSARFSMPEDLSYPLSQATLFPAAHTEKLIETAEQGKKIFKATVFDGQDENGPVEINAVIGKPIAADTASEFDKSLVGVRGWNARLAVFPEQDDGNESMSDYEMSMQFLENGVVKDVTIDYHDFSVLQKLVALEPVKAEECGVE